MSNSSQNGNRHITLLSVTALIAVFLIAILAELMLTTGVRTGKYKDPEIAGKVIRGTIYDANSTALAITVPSYQLNLYKDKINDIDSTSRSLSYIIDSSFYQIKSKIESNKDNTVVFTSGISAANITELYNILSDINPSDSFSITKTTARSYPATYHCRNLIMQTEKSLEKYLQPRAGFYEKITYGSNVKLTIVSEIQYLLDIAMDNLKNKRKYSDYKATVIDSETGAVLAMYSSDKDSEDLAFCDSLYIEDQDKTIDLYFIDSIENVTEEPVYKPSKYGFKYSNSDVIKILNGNGSYSISRFPDKENCKYILLISSEDKIDSSLNSDVAFSVYNGLSAQGRF